MDKVYEISLLLDFYGQLLTEKQFEILDMHYNNDFSLGEIAEQLNISRQGVFDNEKRGKAALHEYESKLGLVEKFSEQKCKAQGILEYIKNFDVREVSTENVEIIKKIENDIKEIIKKM
jgi:uncharacterized protein